MSMLINPPPRSPFQSPASTASLLRARDGSVVDTRSVAAPCLSQKRLVIADASPALISGACDLV
ncbi:hypothetical protein [Paraburkholderia sp. GAS33]|uniref:hypothetical protein n=1 Tax=Paraburkholderia sp. GAS33 TaxID=3035130 RepID=UPI003D1CCEC5